MADRFVRTCGESLGFKFSISDRRDVELLRAGVKVQVRGEGRTWCNGASGRAQEHRRNMRQVRTE